MSDFINSLFSRSFKLDANLESVRPRLPSLFETPLAGKMEYSVPFAGETEQTHEEISLMPRPETGKFHTTESDVRRITEANVWQNNKDFQSSIRVPQARELNADLHDEQSLATRPVSAESYSAELNIRHAIETNVQQNNDFQPAIIISRTRETNHGSHSLYSLGQFVTDTKAIEETKNQNYSTERKLSSPPVKSLFKSITDNNEHMNAQAVKTQPTENKQSHAVFSNLSVSAPFEEKPDFKTPLSEMRLNAPARKSEYQPLTNNKSEVLRDSANVIVDPAVLERIVKDKMAMYTNQENPVQRNSMLNSELKQSPMLAPLDLSKLNLQWPQAIANKSLFENNSEKLAESSEPVINVTIGRIEIRATQAALTKVRKSQAPKPATMSLDDYLNKRNGGAR